MLKLNNLAFKTCIASLFVPGIITSTSALASSSTDCGESRSFLFFKKKKGGSEEKTDSAAAKNDYEKLTTGGAKVSDGMFNIVSKDADWYFEIPRKMLNRDMLAFNKFVKVPLELNEAGVNRGLCYAEQMIRFELDEDAKKIRIRQQRPLPEVNPDDAMAASVGNNYISPVIAAFKIEAYNNDSTAVLIKVNDIFNGRQSSLNNVFQAINIGTSPDTDLSCIKSVKTYDNNIYVVSELTTKVTEPGGTVYVTVEAGTTIALLPETPMTQRFVSPRIGYFSNSGLTYGDSQQRVAKRNYLTRWRLEPKEEDVETYLAGELVEPAKPILFHIDPSTPAVWRKYIRRGIEDWNEAFTHAGFKNAVRVEMLPDSADIDDINYSVLTYAASTKSNAMGPSLVDPRSGEILEADIMWWHNVLDILHDWIIVQTGAVDPRTHTLDLPEELIGDAMRFVACHEVGHSLGLRHNMIASHAVPTDSLRSQSYIEKLGGTSSSIMDYARFNYVAQPGDGVKTLSPHIGPYDRLAIEYGYRWYPDRDPEAEHYKLQTLLDAHTSPLYDYSEAQSQRDATDPRALSEDLGDDAVKSASYGIANLKRIVPHIVEWTTTGEPGQSYDEASRLYYSIISQWQLYIYHVMANIGGMYIDNTVVGDGRRTYTHVDRETQKKSLRFVIDEALKYPEWLFGADVANYTYLVRQTPVGRQELTPAYLLNNAHSYFFWDLLADERLMRMFENEASNGSKAFRAAEMADMLYNEIFKTTLNGGIPGVRERYMQKNLVDALLIAANEKQGVKDGVSKKTIDADPWAMTLRNPSERNCFGIPAAGSRDAVGEETAERRTVVMYGSQANRVSDAVSVKRGLLLRILSLAKQKAASTAGDARNHYRDIAMRINTALGLPQTL